MLWLKLKSAQRVRKIHSRGNREGLYGDYFPEILPSIKAFIGKSINISTLNYPPAHIILPVLTFCSGGKRRQKVSEALQREANEKFS